MISELHDDPFRLAPGDMTPTDEVGVRNLLIAYHLVVEKRERLEGVAQAVAASYRDRLATLEAELAQIRQSLHNYVTVHGGVSLPDAGGCHLTHRKAGINVTDKAALAEWATANGIVETVPDLRAAKATAGTRFSQDGELVPGTEWREPDPSLTIRRAA
jgi:hypothetical protein